MSTTVTISTRTETWYQQIRWQGVAGVAAILLGIFAFVTVRGGDVDAADQLVAVEITSTTQPPATGYGVLTSQDGAIAVIIPAGRASAADDASFSVEVTVAGDFGDEYVELVAAPILRTDDIVVLGLIGTHIDDNLRRELAAVGAARFRDEVPEDADLWHLAAGDGVGRPSPRSIEAATVGSSLRADEAPSMPFDFAPVISGGAVVGFASDGCRSDGRLRYELVEVPTELDIPGSGAQLVGPAPRPSDGVRPTVLDICDAG